MGRTMILATVGALLAFTLQGWTQAPRDQGQQADAAKLIGTWNVTAEEKDGRQTVATELQGKQVRITRDMIACFGKDGKSEVTAEYKLDTSQRPWRLELKHTEGEHKGKTAHGIAQLQADTLRVCVSMPGEEAPTGFRTKVNQCCYTLKRAAGGLDR